MRYSFLFILPSLTFAKVSFNEDVRPIISKNCLACHGPDEEDRKADFHLDTFAGLTKKNDDGQAGAVSGDPEASMIIQRIISTDPDDVMPPAEHDKPLKAEEIETLRQWVQEGAEYERHWSLEKPKAASPPPSTHPSPQNAIDHFVAERLAELDLKPAPLSDPRLLLRRLSLDLTGLPPTLEEVEAFAADPSEANYQAAIDRSLASPAYGEHMAAMWLDIARYADTVGYASDERRDIWPWRDWVINAFNSNMPYDQFTREQLAGDLLPNATDQQILATAFHRNTLNNNEGGTSDEEFRTIAVKDRISTTMNAWMGITLRCAECHTHKYDPITQKEYYQFYAFFNQTEDNDQRDDRPLHPVSTLSPEEYSAIETNIEVLKAAPEVENLWIPLSPSEIKGEKGTTLTAQADQSILATGANPPQSRYLVKTVTPNQMSSGFRLEILPSEESSSFVGRHSHGSISLTNFSVTIAGEKQKIKKAAADYTQGGHNITFAIAENSQNRGWAVGGAGKTYKDPHFAIFSLESPIPPNTEIVVSISQNSPWPQTNIARFRLSATSKPDPATQFAKNTLTSKSAKIAALEKQIVASKKNVPVLKELPADKQRVTKIMARGSYLQPTEEISAGVPTTFVSWPEGAPMNRLGVAEWIMSKENPYTARVAVNRLWARLFGMGIVETEEDFGIQGTTPSHPALLDWIALEYQKNWDTKKLLKLLVSSHTYRQSAIADSIRLEKDPRNIYLSRGPRFRLGAEVVRDNALAVSGLLSDRRYGPPAFPPNPIKRYVNAFSGGMTWVESQGEDRHRRALYTFLKRSSPHPLFETFDMATREVCNMRRIRTNTPLQSFMTLNDIAFIEAAQALARLMSAHSVNPEEQIAHGLHRALLKPGTPAQIETLTGLYHDTLSTYEKDAEAAKKMGGAQPLPEGASQAHIAAMSVVANIILNQDAFLTK
ncbi:PSD1 and planctomycete cytochrome C domain-containing protein [Akkermansiaceae bacterium]|nr:PSD1 and planctomycete cytochrome C domain-containing protein [Akkermansiaceae bacterium]